MKRNDYINGLANSPLPKSIYDQEIQVPDEPEYISQYAQAVLRGFKGSEKYFNEKHKINEEGSNIRQEIKTLEIGINATIESQFLDVKNAIENIQESISENNYDLSDYKELVNKRINDTNEKIEKKSTIITESINNTKIDLQDKISILQTNLQEDIAKNTIETISLKDDISGKAEKVHKHTIKDIQGLDAIIEAQEKKTTKEIKQITDKLEDYATFDEVKEALEGVPTKKEVYTKKEVDQKIDNIKTTSTTVFTGGRGGGGGSSEPSYTPFVLMTNSEREALTPTVGYTVFCTDEIEGLYIYTSDGRQRFSMTVVM